MGTLKLPTSATPRPVINIHKLPSELRPKKVSQDAEPVFSFSEVIKAFNEVLDEADLDGMIDTAIQKAMADLDEELDHLEAEDSVESEIIKAEGASEDDDAIAPPDAGAGEEDDEDDELGEVVKAAVIRWVTNKKTGGRFPLDKDGNVASSGKKSGKKSHGPVSAPKQEGTGASGGSGGRSMGGTEGTPYSQTDEGKRLAGAVPPGKGWGDTRKPSAPAAKKESPQKPASSKFSADKMEQHFEALDNWNKDVDDELGTQAGRQKAYQAMKDFHEFHQHALEAYQSGEGNEDVFDAHNAALDHLEDLSSKIGSHSKSGRDGISSQTIEKMRNDLRAAESKRYGQDD